MNYLDKKFIFAISVFSLLLIIGGSLLATRQQPPKITGLDDFAKCLTSNNAVMYGEVSCTYCQSTKDEFGQSFEYVTYVECPENMQLCEEKGIEGYPTWLLGDGTKLPGQQELVELSEKTSCPLPENYPAT